MSNENLEQLITSLKTEAIQEAEKEAEKILAAADLSAQKVIAEAEEKRQSIIASAQKEAEDIVRKGKSDLRRAARDFNIGIRNDLLRVLDMVFEREVKKSFDTDLIKSVIMKVTENTGRDVELNLSDKLLKELTDFIIDTLQSSEHIGSINVDNTILAGFTITKKDQGWSYDVSPKAITDALRPYLNYRWVRMLKNEEQI